MAEVMSKRKIQDIVFKSYRDVINSKMSAGKDVTQLTTRLNKLLSELKKQFTDGSGFFLSPDPLLN